MLDGQIKQFNHKRTFNNTGVLADKENVQPTYLMKAQEFFFNRNQGRDTNKSYMDDKAIAEFRSQPSIEPPAGKSSLGIDELLGYKSTKNNKFKKKIDKFMIQYEPSVVRTKCGTSVPASRKLTRTSQMQQRDSIHSNLSKS